MAKQLKLHHPWMVAVLPAWHTSASRKREKRCFTPENDQSTMTWPGQPFAAPGLTESPYFWSEASAMNLASFSCFFANPRNPISLG
jgi:hypothetical protein